MLTPSTKELDALLRGETAELRLRSLGTPPSAVLKSLHELKLMDLLTPDLVWEMLAQVDIDPLYLIRTLRKYKAELKLEKEEHLSGGDLLFLRGPKDGIGYTTVCRIGIFTNNIQVLHRKGAGYVNGAARTADQLFSELSAFKAGDERLQGLLQMVGRLLDGNPAEP